MFPDEVTLSCVDDDSFDNFAGNGTGCGDGMSDFMSVRGHASRIGRDGALTPGGDGGYRQVVHSCRIGYIGALLVGVFL